MKKSSLLIVLALPLSLIIPTFAASAENTCKTAYSYPVAGFDLRQPKSAAITVYTRDHGEKYEKDGNYAVLAVAVDNGKVVSVSDSAAVIPENGYVAVARGTALLKELESLAIKTGDAVVFSKIGMEMIFLTENYSPFYSNTIKFDKYNSTRTASTIVIYNKGKKTNTNIWGSEVVVDAEGFVMSVGGNDNEIPEGGMVISAVGKERIAELENAASVGLYVTVDDKAKTISFSFSKESIYGEIAVKYENYVSSLKKARSSFACVDYVKAEEYKTELEKILADVKKANDSDDLASAMTGKYAFGDLYAEALKALTEYPAVEERAVWLRPSNSGSREKVNSIVKAVHDAGFNAVCIELLFNSVTIFPIDTEEYMFEQDPSLGGFDVLEAYIDECHKYGIEVYGWMVGYRVSYGSSTYINRSVTYKKPEWMNIAKSGTVDVGDTAGHFLNPALPEVSELLLKFYEYILTTYDLDGFQLDYIRYPLAEGEDFGYDEYTRGLFRDKYGKDPMDMSKGDALWLDWCKFRASFVTDFVGRVKSLVDRVRPDIFLAADVQPNFTAVYDKYYQESKIWLDSGIIDTVFPMAYGTNVVPTDSAYAVEAAGDDAFAYIGITDYGENVFERQVTETREAGADGFAFFDFSRFNNESYVNQLKNTLFAKSALSPSYSAIDAVKAQVAYTLKRLDYVNSNDVTDELRSLLSSLDEKIAGCTIGEECVGILEEAYAELTRNNSAICSVTAKDIARALKYARLSKDGAKLAYRETHPLPEKYTDEPSEEPSDEESAGEPSEGSAQTAESAENPQNVESEQKGDSFGGPGTWFIIAVAVCVIAVAAAVIIIIRKKQEKKK